MDIVATFPVRVKGPEGIEDFLDEVREKVTRRAYENFVERGAVHGHDLDDWLAAERQLIIGTAAEVYCEGEDVFVEILLPELELSNVTVHIAPRQLVISSDPGEQDLQVCQVIDLPAEVSLDGVDAEQFSNIIRVTAAVA